MIEGLNDKGNPVPQRKCQNIVSDKMTVMTENFPADFFPVMNFNF